MRTAVFFRLLMISLASLVIAVWLVGPAATGITDPGDSQTSGTVSMTSGAETQTPSRADNNPGGQAASENKASPAPPATVSEEFHKLCMAQCKGPLFRCHQFCEYFNK